MTSRGDVLERWVLVRHLGAGGMGSVWLGRADTGEQAAVKVLHPEATGGLASPERFERELSIARRVTSRRVAIPVDSDLDSSPPFIAWEYIEGPTLEEHVAENGPLSGDELLQFGRDLAEALRDLHAAGITHRDVKPSNVILSPNGAVLVDLGIAVLEGQTSMTSRGQVVGTPGWLTPEQLDGQRPTAASDVFNWGSTVTLAATGRGPFGTDTLPRMMYRVAHEPPDIREVSVQLRGYVQRALRKEQSERATSQELAHGLNETMRGVVPGTSATEELTSEPAPTSGETSPLNERLAQATVPAWTSQPADDDSKRVGKTALAIGAGVLLAALLAGGVLVPRGQQSDRSLASAEPTTPADTSTSATPNESSQDESADRVTAPDPDHPDSYFSRNGTTPPLAPDCSGLLAMCLGNPVERAVENFGTEDRRYPSGEQGTVRAWDLDGITLTLTADEVGSIEELSVGTQDRGRATTPVDGIVAGQSSLAEFSQAAPGAVYSNMISGEGMTIVSLWVYAGGEGSHYWSASVNVGWDEDAADALFETSPEDTDALLRLLGDRAIGSFEVGFGEPFETSASTQDSSSGSMGEPPAWVTEKLAEIGDGWRLVSGSTWVPGATLNAVTGNFEGSATGRGMHVFFFVDGRGYIGTDTSQASESVSIAWRDDTTIAVEYTLYRRGDPGCCPTGGSATVRYQWNGSKLVPLDEIPPHYSEDEPLYR